MSAGKTPTRERIIAASVELFAKHGFSDTSFQEIADCCEITQPAIFHHFESKNDLLKAVIDSLIQSNHELVGNQVKATDDAYQRLIKHFVGNLYWAIDRKASGQLIVLLYYYSCFQPEYSALYKRVQATARQRILEHLLAGQREGIFRFREPAPWLAEVLHDELLGAFVNLVTVKWMKSKTDVRAALRDAETKWVPMIKKLTEYEPPYR